ncbi:MAG: hypothetical protein R2729_28270 [Bryobacteraceae bacterium]
MRFQFVALALSSGLAFAQLPVSEVRIYADPSLRVRPFESITLQVRAYGTITKDGGATEKVRLQRGNATMTVVAANGGWVSKPFKYQGSEQESFYQESSSRFGSIFGALTKDYVLQDAFVYTAPETPGKYEVEAKVDSQTGRITIEVANDAPSLRPAEQTNFGPEPASNDPYRMIAEFWAPMLAQETWWQPKSDMPARFDFDGDWNGDDNWDDLDKGSSQAYVHYAAMETPTHWFLIYNVFHPRDYSDKCVAGSCHENDNEGLILTVRKDGSEFGKLEVMETLAHNNVYSFVADGRIRGGVHNVDGAIEFHDGHHPIVFIESGGHGIYGTASSHAAYSVRDDKFTKSTGITFIYKGVAERPRHANDRLVGYELLSIKDQWWSKAVEGQWGERTFDEYYVYQPFGGRPAGRGQRIGSTFLGRKQSSNKAKPFWGWHDNNTRKKNVLNTGQWGLDPAYAVGRDVQFPPGEQPSTDYTYNPYLGVD